LPRTFHG